MYRPEPHPSTMTRPFWEATQRHQLLVPRCDRCQRRFFNPLPACPHCRSMEWSWVESPGTGTLYAYSVVHQAPDPQIEVPYVLAIVDLDDGWRMMTNIVDCDPAELENGMPVTVAFRSISDEFTLPCFTKSQRTP